MPTDLPFRSIPQADQPDHGAFFSILPVMIVMIVLVTSSIVVGPVVVSPIHFELALP